MRRVVVLAALVLAAASIIYLGYNRPSTAEEGEAITVMTYNILCGAGVEEAGQGPLEWAEEHGYPGNRLSRVLDVIRAADPDILGIQEANGWDRGEPPVVQRVAEELGMNFYLGRSTGEESGLAHVALLTGFHIVDAESYPDHFGRGALRAEVVTPAGRSINVFVAHLHPPSRPDIRLKELRFFTTDVVTPYLEEPTILMGDMNFRLRPLDRFTMFAQEEASALQGAGWVNVAVEARIGIDQIWASPSLAPHFRKTPPLALELTKGASDHYPLVAKVVLPAD